MRKLLFALSVFLALPLTAQAFHHRRAVVVNTVVATPVVVRSNVLVTPTNAVFFAPVPGVATFSTFNTYGGFVPVGFAPMGCVPPATFSSTFIFR